jgi:hypothetical protein
MHILVYIIIIFVSSFSESVAVGLLAVSIFWELGSPGFCNVAHGLFVGGKRKRVSSTETTM